MSYKPFELIEMADINGEITISIDSSYVEGITYNAYSRRLGVVINGSTYDYYPVSLHQFERFVNTESVGRFYNQHVKGRW